MTATIRRRDPGAAVRRDIARRQSRRRASRELDELLGMNQPGRVWYVGEYAPHLARIALARAEVQEQFITDARRYALEVLLAIESGADAAEVWAQILHGGARLRGAAPDVQEAQIE